MRDKFELVDLSLLTYEHREELWERYYNMTFNRDGSRDFSGPSITFKKETK